MYNIDCKMIFKRRAANDFGYIGDFGAHALHRRKQTACSFINFDVFVKPQSSCYMSISQKVL